VAGALAQPTEPSSPQDGQIWIDTDGTAPTTVVTRWTKQPAAGTTSLTGNDDYSIPLAYSAGYEEVFLNGVLLSRGAGEYTATSGTAITLAAATVAGDIVEVICPLQIATTDTYTQSAVNNAFQANTNNFAAGKNKIINGDFGVWQRGSSFTPTTGQVYTTDRFLTLRDGTGATVTVSRQTFIPNAGGNPTNAVNGRNYFYRQAQSVAGTGGTYNLMEQRIEGAVLAGQTVTFSFWAKAAASLTLPQIDYEYTIGGTNVSANVTSNISITTSWARYSYTFTMPTYSGYTPDNTSDFFGIRLWYPSNTTFTFDTWGWQLEAGSNATAFQTATGTIQGELAACQRYYVRFSTSDAYAGYSIGTASQTNTMDFIMSLPVTLRVNPTALDYSNIGASDGANAILSGGTFAIPSATNGNDKPFVRYTKTGATQFRPYYIINNAGAGYIGFSAEL
jgi:hypothetical protein